MRQLYEIYQYREMVHSLIRRDLRGRYKGSVLGFLWTFLNPLLQLGVYTLVFSVIMRNGIPDYYMFLFVALVPWIFFSVSLTNGASCILSQKDMVQKIYFPRQVLPIAFVTSQFINMIFSFLVIFVALLISGKGFQLIALYYFPFILMIEYILALGIALFVSAVTVYFRDLEYILGILTMAWQFLSPVIYSMEQVPDHLRHIFLLNPMTSVLTAYRDILYYKQIPKFETLFHAFGVSIVLLAIGWITFQKLSRRFAEEL